MLQNIIFKDSKMMAEFTAFIDPRLQAFLLWLAYWLDQKWEKNLTITCLNRTVEENKEVNGSKYSAHLTGLAVDIRSWTLTSDKIEELIKTVEDSWGDMIYILYHNSGSGAHIHINIRYKYFINKYSQNGG